MGPEVTTSTPDPDLLRKPSLVRGEIVSATVGLHEFPRELYVKAAAAGLTGIGYQEAYGGSGGDLSHALAATEELIVAGTSVGVSAGLGSHAVALPPILAVGTEAQKQRFIPPVLRGEKVAALAITEPGGGSDVAGLTTRAARDGDVMAHRVLFVLPPTVDGDGARAGARS
jgi:alkylation response protein AidB-like acyl-CoA dehydrogenase